MDCIDENQALQYVEGLFDEEEARAIEAHLAECAECRYLLAAAGGAALIESPSSAPTQLHRSADEGQSSDVVERKIGDVLQDTYVVERYIGKGGMGQVFEVSHRRLARRFAIKFVTGARAADEEAIARMQREAYVTSRLSHPNIIQVTDFNYADDGAPYIVMELLEGESLAERLMRQGAIDRLQQVSEIVRQVTSALQAAHLQGIVHRDLTPGNIFLCDQGLAELPLVKVMDFGLSKILERNSRKRPGGELTRVVSVLGSPHFMSPEQATGHSATADHRADIFSLGAILYRMLCGQLPFFGKSEDEVLRRVAFEEPASPDSWLAVPVPLRVVALRAMSKDPANRQQSMNRLWLELDDALQLLGVGESSVELTADLPLPAVTPRSPWRHPVGLVAAALVLLVVSALVVIAVVLLPAEPGLEVPERGLASMPPRTDLARAAAAAGVRQAEAVQSSAAPDAATWPTARSAPDASAWRAPDAAAPSAPDATVVYLATRPTDRGVAPDRGDAGTLRVGSSQQRRPRRAGFGAISVQTTAEDGSPLWADVYLNGRRVGQSALTLKQIPAGRHRVEIRRAGYRNAVRTVRLRPGQRLRVQLRLVASSDGVGQ